VTDSPPTSPEPPEAAPDEDGRSIRARRRRAATRAHILRVAASVFGSRGYHATSVAEVIKEAEIARGTFYLHFESRDALFHELIDGFVAELIDHVQPVTPDANDPVGDLRRNIERVIEHLHAHPALTTLLFREAVGMGHEVDQKLERLDAYMHKMVVGALRRGAEWRLIRDIPHKEIYAAAIMGMLREMMYQSLVARRFRRDNAEDFARAAFDMAFVGLRMTDHT